MKNDVAYFVARRLKEDAGRSPEYLALDGPFEYPVWKYEPTMATPLTPAKAAQCAAVFVGVEYEARLITVAEAMRPDPLASRRYL